MFHFSLSILNSEKMKCRRNGNCRVSSLAQSSHLSKNQFSVIVFFFLAFPLYPFRPCLHLPFSSEIHIPFSKISSIDYKVCSPSLVKHFEISEKYMILKPKHSKLYKLLSPSTLNKNWYSLEQSLE